MSDLDTMAVPPATDPVTPSPVLLPAWAPLMPWFTLFLIELPSIHWLWGFRLSHAGTAGVLLPLAAYLALAGAVWLLGWIIEPVISGLLGRARSAETTRRWQFLFAGALAWGACGLTTPIFLALSPDAHPGGVFAWVALALALFIGVGIALGILQGLQVPGKLHDPTVPPGKRARTVLLGMSALAGMFAMGHIWTAITPERPGTTPKPNVLLVTMDTVNIERVSAYGYHLDTTPNLSRLAREGVKFTQAYAHVPLTQPSHANIFFGLQPQALGVYENQRPTPHKPVSLAERFRSHGWFTAGIPATLMMREKYGMAQGFDRWPERTAESGLRGLQWSRLGPLRMLQTVFGSGPDLAHIIDDARHGTARALEAVDYAAHRSWFMWVHYYDPHAPYTLPKNVREKHYLQPTLTPGFDPDSSGQVKSLYNFSYWGLEPLLGACFLQQNGMRPVEAAASEIEDLRRTYDAQLHYTDAWLGTLLDELKSHGELDNTLVIITADHGEGLFGHGYFGHNFTIHQDEVHVPLIIWWPGKIQPRVVDDPVGLSDLYPTMLSLTGLTPPNAWLAQPEAVRGRDFGPVLLGVGPPPAKAPVYLQVVTFSRGMVTPEGEKVIFQAVKGQTEYAANPFGGPMWQWFALRADPAEESDLVPTAQAGTDEAGYRQFTDLQGTLDRIARSIEGRPVGELNFQGYVRIAISDEERKALESLGYLTPTGSTTVMDSSKCQQPVERTPAREQELADEAAASVIGESPE